MAESLGALPLSEGPEDRSGIPVRTRYRLTLKPSDELHEMIDSFLRPEAIRRIIGLRALRLVTGDYQVEINRADPQSVDLLSDVNDYAHMTAKYSKDFQFRLFSDGFSYQHFHIGDRDFASFDFTVATSAKARSDIKRQPFFDMDNNDPFQASIVFPDSYLVPYVDSQAKVVDRVMHARHPSGTTGLASFAFNLYNLQVTGREVRVAPPLRIVKPGDEA